MHICVSYSSLIAIRDNQLQGQFEGICVTAGQGVATDSEVLSCVNSLQWQVCCSILIFYPLITSDFPITIQVATWVNHQCGGSHNESVVSQDESLVSFRQEVQTELGLDVHWSLDDVFRKYQEKWNIYRESDSFNSKLSISSETIRDRNVLIVGNFSWRSGESRYMDYLLRDVLGGLISRYGVDILYVFGGLEYDVIYVPYLFSFKCALREIVCGTG